MCVYIRDIKKPVQIDFTLGSMCSKKKVGWEVSFSEHAYAYGFAGSGHVHVSPGSSSKAGPISHFFMFSEA